MLQPVADSLAKNAETLFKLHCQKFPLALFQALLDSLLDSLVKPRYVFTSVRLSCSKRRSNSCSAAAGRLR